MRFIRIRIKNFKSIENLELKDIEDALILVGKNNTGKTSVMDAVRTMTGARCARPEDFDETYKNIEIEVELELTAEDLAAFHSRGAVSAYKRYALWEQEVRRRLPSLRGNVLSFTCIINRDGTRRLSDGFKKHNKYIDEMMPQHPLHRHRPGYGAAAAGSSAVPGPRDAKGSPHRLVHFRRRKDLPPLFPVHRPHQPEAPRGAESYGDLPPHGVQDEPAEFRTLLPPLKR